MRFLLLVLLIPLLLMPLAAVGIHVTLCEMHVTAVDGMRDKKASTERQGRSTAIATLWRRLCGALSERNSIAMNPSLEGGLGL